MHCNFTFSAVIADVSRGRRWNFSISIGFRPQLLSLFAVFIIMTAEGGVREERVYRWRYKWESFHAPASAHYAHNRSTFILNPALSQRRNEAIRRLKTKCSTLKKIRFPHTGTIMGSCLCLFGWILLWIKLSSNIIAQKLELLLFVGLRWVGASLYMKAKETHRLWWVHIHRCSLSRR